MVGEDQLESRPFESEHEFWNLASLYLALELLAQKARIRLLDNSDPRFMAGWLMDGPGGEAFNTIEGPALVNEVALEYLERVGDALYQRIRATGRQFPAPRIIRLFYELELAYEDLQLLLILILSEADNLREHVGSSLLGDVEIGEAARLFNWPVDRWFSLYDAGHPLVVEDVLEIEDSSLRGLHARDVKVELVPLKFLRGLQLTPDDGFALHGVLRELALEEPDMPFGLDDLDEMGTAEPSGPGDAGSPGEPEEEFDLDSFIREESEASGPDELPSDEDIQDGDDLGAFTTDIEYLEAFYEWFNALAEWKQLSTEEDDPISSILRESENVASKVRRAKSTERAARKRIDRRLQLTLDGDWLPRAEKLARARGLTEFEKHVLLLAATDTAFRQPMESGRLQKFRSTVGALLFLFFESLEERLAHRKHFYRDAALVRDGLITLDGYGDLLTMSVEVDRRMTDFLLGLEAEASSLVEGSHLYTPKVQLDRVVLPERDKELITQAVQNYPSFQRQRARTGFDDLVSYGRGLVMLFYGPSGTGKTMMANALANHLGKRVLLINFPQLNDADIRLVLREAKINDAVVFFDECEGIFHERDHFGMSTTGTVLSELERHDGLVLLATNRPVELDEAMRRRITLALEFRVPDATQRAEIWRVHIPQDMPIEGDLDLAGLAYEYELTGGLIKNAVLAALAIANGRDPDNPVVTQEDLEEGARRQLRGRLQMAEFDNRIVPARGLDELVLPVALLDAIKDLIGLEKARRTLIGRWGFKDEGERGMGATALFHGPPGTGKTLAAEAVAYELGRPVKQASAATLVARWDRGGAGTVQDLFREARQHEAVLLFDEADALFASRTHGSSAERYANLDIAVLLQEMDRFPGVVILTSNMPDAIDDAFRRRLRFVLEFPSPDAADREQLWELHFPEEMPLASDVSVEGLASEYNLTGAQIRNVVHKAAARAALRQEGERAVGQDDLVAVAEAELEAGGGPRVVGFNRS